MEALKDAPPIMAGEGTMRVEPGLHPPAEASYDAMWDQVERERQIAKLSVVMIVRENAQTLMNIIPRIMGGVYEVIVLDTGSTDGTVGLCHEMGAKVYQTIWKNDFSEARNEAMSKASGKWILSLDSDEVLHRDMVRLLNRVLAKADPEKDCFWIEVEMKNDALPLEGNMNVQLRCFPNLYHRGLRWKHAVHEQIAPGLEALGFKRVTLSQVRIQHVGYNDPKDVRIKCARNREMLARELATDPPPRPRYITRYHAAKCAMVVGLPHEALDYVRQVAEDADCLRDFKAQAVSAYRFWGEILSATRLPEKAVEVWRRAEAMFPDDMMFPALVGLHLKMMGRADEAIEELEKSINLPVLAGPVAAPATRMQHQCFMALTHSYREKALRNGIPADEKMHLLYKADEYERRAVALIGMSSHLETVPEPAETAQGG